MADQDAQNKNREKLEGYQKSLAQVDELLKSNPSDENLLKLKSDLVNVIDLTKTLVAEQDKAAGISTYESAPTYNQAGTGDDYYNAQNSNSALSKDTETGQKNIDKDKKKKKKSKGFYIGGRCEVDLNGRWFACVIDSIGTDPETNTPCYDVRFIINNREEKVLANSGRMREIRSGKKGKPAIDIFNLKLGAIVSAKFSQDGEWYRAKVVEIAKEGCMVQYTEYGNKEKVPFEYMVKDEEGEVEVNNPYLAGGAAVDTSNSAVPDHLKILPTDSESVQKKKKRRLKELKRRSKTALEEHMSDQRQRGWQDFQAKKKGKRKKGHYASIKKKSIFAVPDVQVDGMGIMSGRVGVIGSGKGMTEFNDHRLSTSTVKRMKN